MKALLPIVYILFIFACNPLSNERLNLKDIPVVKDMTLLPSGPGKTPNYWCTWSAQNYAIDSITVSKSIFGIEGHSVIARNLTEEIVFGKNGWASEFSKIRKDLYLMFDVGWDVPSDMNFDDSRWKLGSQEVATDKFPSCTGTPAEKLKKLNDLSKAAGWKGAGIWIPAHAWQDGKDGKMLNQKELEAFFRERAKWTNIAGIEYWKVDYGSRGSDLEFRKMVTRIAREEAPALWIEHCTGSGPLNDFDCPWDCKATGSGEYINWCNGEKLKASMQLLQFCQVLRTYDVTSFLSVPTTLDRVAQILNTYNKNKKVSGILNCEDEPYMAATLGCMMGIMRHPSFISVPGYDYDPLQMRNRIDEVTRAVRWQRIAPATGIGQTYMLLDSARLTDFWDIKKGDSWTTWLFGKTVKQSAPAKVSRNLPLPVVKCDGEPPYVLASKNEIGAIAVATLIRHNNEKGFYFPIADIEIEIEIPVMPVAVFGKYKSLKLNYQRLPANYKVYAQDLAGETVYDISQFIEKEGNTITLSGKLIETIGLSGATPGDMSEPGLMLVIKVLD